jgi:hypothetical protein
MMDTDPRVREAVVDMIQAHAAIARRQLETLGSSMAEASVAGKEVDWREVRDVSLTASSSSQLICRGALPLDVVTDEIVHTLRHDARRAAQSECEPVPTVSVYTLLDDGRISVSSCDVDAEILTECQRPEGWLLASSVAGYLAMSHDSKKTGSVGLPIAASIHGVVNYGEGDQSDMLELDFARYDGGHFSVRVPMDRDYTGAWLPFGRLHRLTPEKLHRVAAFTHEPSDSVESLSEHRKTRVAVLGPGALHTDVQCLALWLPALAQGFRDIPFAADVSAAVEAIEMCNEKVHDALNRCAEPEQTFRDMAEAYEATAQLLKEREND